jgi:hypothetical protein
MEWSVLQQLRPHLQIGWSRAPVRQVQSFCARRARNRHRLLMGLDLQLDLYRMLSAALNSVTEGWAGGIQPKGSRRWSTDRYSQPRNMLGRNNFLRMYRPLRARQQSSREIHCDSAAARVWRRRPRQLGRPSACARAPLVRPAAVDARRHRKRMLGCLPRRRIDTRDVRRCA